MDKAQLCFYYGCANIIKYGKTHCNKPKCKCKDCHRQFVVSRSHQLKLTDSQKELIGDLLLERLSLEGVICVLKISAYQLYQYMDVLYTETPNDLHVNDLLFTSKDIDLQRFEC